MPQLVVLHRAREGIKTSERHRGVGWKLLTEKAGCLIEGRTLFKPNLEEVLSDRLPKTSFWTGSILKIKDKYYAFMTISEYDEKNRWIQSKNCRSFLQRPK